MPDSSVTPVPPLDLAPLLSAIGDLNRWKILQVLSRSEPLMVIEIAPRIGHSADNTSKHLALLRKAGAVLRGRGNLYQIPPAYLVSLGVIDYGSILLRFPPLN